MWGKRKLYTILAQKYHEDGHVDDKESDVALKLHFEEVSRGVWTE
jgi:hypothetical protein